MPKGFSDYSQAVQEKIVHVKPGLTGVGSIVFRDEESIIARAQTIGRDLRTCYREDIMPFKGALECWYVDNRSFWVDIKILVATAVAVLRPGWKGYRNWFRGLPSPQSVLVQEHVADAASV